MLNRDDMTLHMDATCVLASCADLARCVNLQYIAHSWRKLISRLRHLVQPVQARNSQAVMSGVGCSPVTLTIIQHDTPV